MSIEAEGFCLESIKDELDPYSIVVISGENGQYCSTADQIDNDAWSDVGVYDVKVVNRLGYSYSFQITVVESDIATINFTGEGTESTSYIQAIYGEQNVKLPEIMRKGYKLIGFEDESGTVYSEEIATILFRGTKILNAIWQAKQYTLTLQKPDGSVIDTKVMDYGQSIELYEPALEDGEEFIGWMLNGKLLDSDEFTLDIEGDVTLIAVFKNYSGETSTEHTTQIVVEQADDNLSDDGHMGIVIFVIVVEFGTVVGFYVHQRRKKDVCDNVIAENEQDKEEGEDEK
jgi:hypothetical protein